MTEKLNDLTRTVVRVGKSVPPRDIRSDYLKAAAIVGVVCIHAAWPFAEVFRFCVPVFVAIWAFHFELGLARREVEDVWPYTSNRFIRLLVPYAFWTAIYLILFPYSAAWRTTLPHTIIGGWFGGYGWSGQYFFIILFQLTWLAPFLRRAVNWASVWVAAAGGVVLNAIADYFLFHDRIVSGVGDRLFIYWIPYVCLGIAFARGFPRLYPSFFIFAAALLLAAPAEFGRLVAGHQQVSPYLTATVTVGSVALLLAVGPRVGEPAPSTPKRAPNLITKAVAYIGQHTLSIFVGNPLMIECARRAGLVPHDDLLLGFLEKVLLVGYAIGGSLALGWLLRRARLGLLVGG